MDERAKKIKSWLSVRENQVLIGIIVLAFAIRLYYFFLTKGQALWWDEAEYMLKAKSIALGTPDTGWWVGRPILFSAILSGFYFLGLGEISIRFALILVSVLSVYLVYYIGKKLFNENTGLISSFLYSMFYLNLFYSVRIMVDVLSLTLGLLAFSFYISGKKRLIWAIIPVLVIATLIRFPSFFFFVILLIYMFMNEGISLLKKKDYWFSAIFGIIIALPYLIWSQIKFGSPLYAVLYAGEGAVSGITFSSGFAVFMEYIKNMPSYLHSVLVIMLVLGLFWFYDMILGFDMVKTNKELRNKAFLLIWIAIITLYFGFFVSHFEDRYIFGAFPAIFFIIAIGIISLGEYTKKYVKNGFAVVVIILVLVGGYQLVNHSNEIIKDRISSFEEVKEAGLWVKDYTNSGDKIMIRSHPQNTYYSERASYSISNDENDFVSNFTEIKPKYVIISSYDSPQDMNWWGYSINTSKYGLIAVKGIPEKQPVLIIFKTSF